MHARPRGGCGAGGGLVAVAAGSGAERRDLSESPAFALPLFPSLGRRALQEPRRDPEDARYLGTVQPCGGRAAEPRAFREP